jgi:hypothetical protein
MGMIVLFVFSVNTNEAAGARDTLDREMNESNLRLRVSASLPSP